MKTFALIALLFFAAIRPSASQQSDTSSNGIIITPITKQQYNNKIGFGGSMFSGYGLSYEYNVSGDNTIEFNGSVWGKGGENQNSYLVASIGAEFQRTLFFTRDTRFYGYVGTSFWLDNTDYNYTYSYSVENYKRRSYVAGLGLGWEFSLGKRISMNLECGYLYEYKTDSGNEYIYTSSSSQLKPYDRTSYRLGFGIGGGIYYTF